MSTNPPVARIVDVGNKYRKAIHRDSEGLSDVYDVLRAFNVTDPALQHAIKKMLMPGQRGGKSVADDLAEAANSAQKAAYHFARLEG